MQDKVLKHFGAKIVDEWSNECDFYIYEESTADGYSIFVAAQNPSHIIVEENIYYYDSDLGDALLDALRHYWVEEIMVELLVWVDERNEENK